VTLGIRPYFHVDVDYTWPAEFVAMVWGDGKTTGNGAFTQPVHLQ
jgi:hypothetical protein